MSDGRSPQAKSAAFDPILLAVLSNRFESIIREMTNTVMKASRSSVIKNARDMSCGILTYDHRLVSVEEALPIHVTALELTTKPITALFDDIKEGDAFLNNSPFYGGTHHADLTLCVPVFCEGEVLFQADIGLGHLLLKRNRALDGVDGAGELDQYAVAHELDYAPLMQRHKRRED